jgi:hypothetical protein
MDQIV